MNNRLNWILDQLTRVVDTRVTGYLGEILILELLKDTRWRAYQPRAHHIGDLVVTDTSTGEILKVEVKTARRGTYQGRWQFLLRKHDQHGVTDISHSDIVILLAIDDNNRIYPYVIPSKFMEQRTKVALTSHPEKYSGRIASFRQSIKSLSLDTQGINKTVANYYGHEQVQYAIV